MRRQALPVLAVLLAVAGVVTIVTADEPILYAWYASTGGGSSDYDSVWSLDPEQWQVGEQRLVGVVMLVVAVVVLAAVAGRRVARRRRARLTG